MPPLNGVAVNVTDPPVHTGLALAAIVTLTGRIGLTIMVTVLEVAGFPEVQVSLDVNTHTISSPCDGMKENTLLLTPTFKPFSIHWYAGAAPPLIAEAVKVTWVPSHTGFASAVIDTLTGNSGFTVIATVLVGNGPPQAPEASCICR